VNRFVAGFLGTPAMNFLGGTIAAEGGGTYFQMDAVRIRLPDDTAGRVQGQVGKKVTLGVRPEDIGVEGAGKFAGTENVLATTVRVVEPLGDEQIVHMGGPADLPIVCKLDAHVRVAVDEPLEAYLDMGRIHLFDDQTGDNIGLEPEHVAHAG
jgi:multiple sugar transport system ATP-binding protein